MFIAYPDSDDGHEPSQPRLHARHLGGIGTQESSSSRSSDHPSSSAVIIPLVISMVLILLGIGTAVLFYISYRRRHRRWVADFRARREEEMRRFEKEEKEGEGGPGWWEVEVGDKDEENGYVNPHEKAQGITWNVRLFPRRHRTQYDR